MNSCEREICARLKLFRESIGFNQQDFSSRLGISLHQLASVEYERTPLRYQIAWRVQQIYNLSLAWLVNGKSFPHLPDLDPWPTPESIKDASSLLSEIEASMRFLDLNSPAHKQAEKIWFEEYRKTPKSNSDRASLIEMLAVSLDEWMKLVPDHDLRNFTTDIFEFAQSKASKYSKDLNVKTSLHARALIRGQMRQEIEKRLSRQAADISNLTKSETSAKSSDVKAQLPELLDRIKKATSASGKKTELAGVLKAPLASVSRWLSGEREPGGEIALKMDAWATGQGYPRLPSKHK